MSPDDRQPVYLKCRPCGYTWVAAHVPMPVRDFARLMRRAACPRCGGREQLYLYEPGTAPPPPAEEQTL